MKRILGVALMLFALGCLVAAAPASAGQHDPTRTAFFIGVGAGWANAGAQFQGVDPDRENAFSGSLRFGWAVMDNMTIGLESSSWAKKYEITGTTADLELVATVTTFAVTYFPQNMGFYMRGGLGVATGRAKLEDAGFSFTAETEAGLGLLAATGYEWRLTEKFALGPQVQYAYLNIDGDGTESVDFVAVTAQANWYW